MRTLTPHYNLKAAALLAIDEINKRGGEFRHPDCLLRLRRVEKAASVVISRKKLGPAPLMEGENRTFTKFGLRFIEQQQDKTDITLRLLRFEPIKS
jgi:hypothetical protein